MQHIDLSHQLILAGVLNVLGAALRSVAVKLNPPSYIITMVGQIVGSSAAPLALNIMTTVSSGIS